MFQLTLLLLVQKVINNFIPSTDDNAPLTIHYSASPDITAEDTDEEDVQEIVSQTSPIVQVFFLLIHQHLTDI